MYHCGNQFRVNMIRIDHYVLHSIRARYGTGFISTIPNKARIGPRFTKSVQICYFDKRTILSCPKSWVKFRDQGAKTSKRCGGVGICPCNVNKGLLSVCRIKIVRGWIVERRLECGWFYDGEETG